MRHQPYVPRIRRIPHTTAVITVRQAQCLDYLLDGLNGNEMSVLFGNTPVSVRRTLTRLYRTLGARDRAHAVGLVLTGRVTVLVRDPNGERRAAA